MTLCFYLIPVINILIHLFVFPVDMSQKICFTWHMSVCWYVCLLSGKIIKLLMNFVEISGGVQCVTSKNWLDFGDDLPHVTSGLGLGLRLRLQLPLRRFMISWVLLVSYCNKNNDDDDEDDINITVTHWRVSVVSKRWQFLFVFDLLHFLTNTLHRNMNRESCYLLHDSLSLSLF